MSRIDVSELAKIIFDLIVIGGGITGAAIARDATLRGLKVLVLDKNDFASGASSKSSKLIHGGLRYLENYQFKLVAESVREREQTLKLAPHLTKLQPFMYMLYDGAPDKKLFLNLGLTFYDIVSGSWMARRHKMLSTKNVLTRQPTFNQTGLRGAALYYDLATDDARLTIETLKSALELGAVAVNHCEVIGLTQNDQKYNGVIILDHPTKTKAQVNGHYIINAAGSWSDHITQFVEPTAQHMHPTKGIHIVLDKVDFSIDSAVFVRSPDDGRLIWPIPSLHDDRIYIGTTDSDFDGDFDNVYPERSEVQYLLNAANFLIPSAKLNLGHVKGAWAGLRPLIAPKKQTNNNSAPREHQVLQNAPGFFSIIGGKLTSHRVMARHLLDAVIKADQNQYLLSLSPSNAAKLPISGGAITNPTKASIIETELSAMGVPHPFYKRWIKIYGSNASIIANIWTEMTDKQDIAYSNNITPAEIKYCVKHELAFTLSDFMIRRTSQFFWEIDGGMNNINEIADEMQTLIGWSNNNKRQEIANYQKTLNNNRIFLS